jgi:DNA-binding CsgD family transcriptional regulator
MAAPSLQELIEGPFIKGDPILKSLLTEAESHPLLLLYACRMDSRKMIYMSPRCEAMLGYAQELFIQGGAEFFFSITDPTVIPAIINKQLAYTRLSKKPGFNQKKVIIQEYPTQIKTGTGQLKEILSLATVLTYTQTGEWEFGVALLVQSKSALDSGKAILKAVKSRHNKIYKHKAFTGDTDLLPVVHLINERVDKKITKREAQIIQLLAGGQSTSNIATHLNISANTVESHRKKLLSKFEAKNSAELIKKASKVFWLE